VKQNLPRYLLYLLGMASMLAIPTLARAATMAHWNFNQGATGSNFDVPAGIPVQDLSGNGNLMFGFQTFSPVYSAAGDTPNGAGLSSTHNGGQDGFTHPAVSPVLNNWEPEQWTIEAAVNLDVVSAFRTFITRDGGSTPPASDFYLQTNGANNVRVDFATVGGPRVEVVSNFIPTIGQWFRAAATSDNTTARLWIDRFDGNGYQLAGSTAIPGATAADRALASVGANWVFGRGWFNGGFFDHITGNLDDIRFSDVALVPGQLIPEPAAVQLVGMMLLGLAGYRGGKRSGS
jgi:hypothetical protein